jgi:hypothetical protein
MKISLSKKYKEIKVNYKEIKVDAPIEELIWISDFQTFNPVTALNTSP